MGEKEISTVLQASDSGIQLLSYLGCTFVIATKTTV